MLTVSFNHSCRQGGDHVRISHLVKDNELIRYRFDDAKTLYECFQRGKRVSSEQHCFMAIVSLIPRLPFPPFMWPGNEASFALHPEKANVICYSHLVHYPLKLQVIAILSIPRRRWPMPWVAPRS